MTTQNQSNKATPAQVSPPALQATTEAAQIKWRLVPDAYSMTDEQAEAIAKVANCCGGIAYEIYRAALAASPTPPPQAEQQAPTLRRVERTTFPNSPAHRALHAFVSAMHDNHIKGDDMRAAMLWFLGYEECDAALQQAAPKAAPDHPPMPENWGVVVSVNSENILCIGQDYLHGKRELSEAEELAIVGMAQHLLAFVGYGLPPSIFDPDDDAAPKQEAQEPMAIKAMGYGGSTGINDYLMSDGTIKAMRPSEVVWAAPQPAPAPPSDDVVKDAARRWDAPKYNHRQREWCIAYEVETGFDPMMDDYEAGLQTFAEAAEASLRWYEDHTSDAHLRISRKTIPGGRYDAALAAQGGQ